MPPSLNQAAAQHLRRCALLMTAGNLQDALHAASDACHAAPDHPHPHYAYGETRAALGQPALAAQAFAAAVSLAPDWADAWVNLGIARYREGSIEDAKIAMRQALARAPGHPAAAANLAAFMRITGDPAAEDVLQAALARDPCNDAARLNLAADMLLDERADDALALLDAAPPPTDESAHRHWLLQRALALLQAGRAKEVPGVLDAFVALGPVPPALRPLLHWRRLLLAEAAGDDAAALAQAAAMQQALEAMGAEGLPEHRIMGHYDLAKFWSARRQHAAAFSHWQKGHALLRLMQPFSRADHLAFIEAAIARLDRARLHNGPRASPDDPAPVFIVGMPRSGTTLCEQIIAAHADAHGAGERAALTRMFTRLGEGDDAAAIHRIAGLDSRTLDAAAKHYLDELHALAPGKLRIVDKMPGNYLYLGLVGLLLPGARIIHCVRDPRDIGLSIFTFRFHGSHGYAHDPADLGWTIGQQERLMAHWKAVLPNPVLTVALSDWVDDFDGTLARVLAHLDLPRDPACERFHESTSRVRTVSRAQVRQPVNARGLGRWKQYATELQPLIDELQAAGMLEDWDDQSKPVRRGAPSEPT
jgi:Flp pilus assembly protein TadD